MAKTLAVVGAGPGIGLAVAERFGREGFRVALLARSEDKLDRYVKRLADLGVEAAGFVADVTDRPALVAALQHAKSTFGPIDVLEYSPTGTPDTLQLPRAITVEGAQFHFEYGVLGAVAAVREVLPDMLAAGDGALLFTTAASASSPVPFSSNFAIAASGVRSYAHTLNQDLAADGIYAGILLVAGFIDARHPDEPVPDVPETVSEAPRLSVIPVAEVADRFWDMYTRRERPEEIVGNIEALHALIASLRAGLPS